VGRAVYGRSFYPAPERDGMDRKTCDENRGVPRFHALFLAIAAFVGHSSMPSQSHGEARRDEAAAGEGGLRH